MSQSEAGGEWRRRLRIMVEDWRNPCFSSAQHNDLTGKIETLLIGHVDEILALLSESVARDAARYRWLREANLTASGHQISMVTMHGMEHAFEDLDAAVDEAMRSTGNNDGGGK